MFERLTTAGFALLLALQPLSTWTLLGIFGSDHTLRLAMIEGTVSLVLAHGENGVRAPHDHHTAADHVLANTDDDPFGAEHHTLRSIRSDTTPPKRAATAMPLVIPLGRFGIQSDPGAFFTGHAWRSLLPDPPPRTLPLLL